MNEPITQPQKDYILKLLEQKYVSPKRFRDKFNIDLKCPVEDIARQLDACTAYEASKIIDYLKERKPLAYRMYRKTILWAKKNKIKHIRNKLTKAVLREKVYESGLPIPDDIREYLDTTWDDDYSEDYWP